MKFRRQTRRKVAPVFDLTPMIDVVFQLLLFFMVTSSFVVTSNIPIDIAQATKVEQNIEKKNLTLTLTDSQGGPEGGGRIFVNDGKSSQDIEVSSWDDLKQQVTTLVAGEENPVVSIRPDKDVPSGRTIYVMGLLNEVGIRSFAVQAQQAEGGAGSAAPAGGAAAK